MSLPVPGASPAAPRLAYADRPEVAEVFAHAARRITFDGFNMQIEFVVNRMDDPDPSGVPSGRAVTAARLVVPLPGILELHAGLGNLIQSLTAQGVLHKTPAAAGPRSLN